MTAGVCPPRANPSWGCTARSPVPESCPRGTEGARPETARPYPPRFLRSLPAGASRSLTCLPLQVCVRLELAPARRGGCAPAYELRLPAPEPPLEDVRP